MKLAKLVSIALFATLAFASASSATGNVTNLKITTIWIGQGSFTLTTVNTSGTTYCYYFWQNTASPYLTSVDACKMMLSSVLYAWQNGMYVDLYDVGNFQTGQDYANQLSIHY
jgi:hypothetical protein